ncbi:hypothetical protein V1478_002016 [Vespula squamosa]|uniref:Uncharacterized protein n=1 Tax=Vespula squamosa TaxID=30214 RepID=A0ABD2BYS9_VESSQ
MQRKTLPTPPDEKINLRKRPWKSLVDLSIDLTLKHRSHLYELFLYRSQISEEKVYSFSLSTKSSLDVNVNDVNVNDVDVDDDDDDDDDDDEDGDDADDDDDDDELTCSSSNAHGKHLNKLLLFVERFERMATPIALTHRRHAGHYLNALLPRSLSNTDNANEERIPVTFAGDCREPSLKPSKRLSVCYLAANATVPTREEYYQSRNPIITTLAFKAIRPELVKVTSIAATCL